MDNTIENVCRSCRLNTREATAGISIRFLEYIDKLRAKMPIPYKYADQCRFMLELLNKARIDTTMHIAKLAKIGINVVIVDSIAF